MNNFLSKEEAVKITEDKLSQQEQEATIYLFKAIRQAAERGEYSVTVPTSVAEANQEILTNLRYEIVSCEYYLYKQIRW